MLAHNKHTIEKSSYGGALELVLQIPNKQINKFQTGICLDLREKLQENLSHIFGNIAVSLRD